MTRKLGRIKTIGSAVAACLAIGAGAADAGIVATLLNPNPAPHISTGTPTISLYTTSSGSSTYVSNLAVMHGGAFQWNTVSNDTGIKLVDGLGTASSTDFTTFCIDLTQYIYPGQNHAFTLTELSSAPKPASGPLPASGMGANAAFYLQQLWAQHFTSIFSQATPALKNTYASAFQLAIWEIEYEQGTTFNLAQGFLRVTNSGDGAVTSLASSWLSGLKNQSTYQGPLANLVALSAGYQDQLAQIHSNPEPGSIAVWLGVAAVGGFMRRRRSRREVA